MSETNEHCTATRELVSGISEAVIPAQLYRYLDDLTFLIRSLLREIGVEEIRDGFYLRCLLIIYINGFRRLRSMERRLPRF